MLAKRIGRLNRGPDASYEQRLAETPVQPNDRGAKNGVLHDATAFWTIAPPGKTVLACGVTRQWPPHITAPFVSLAAAPRRRPPVRSPSLNRLWRLRFDYFVDDIPATRPRNVAEMPGRGTDLR